MDTPLSSSSSKPKGTSLSQQQHPTSNQLVIRTPKLKASNASSSSSTATRSKQNKTRQPLEPTSGKRRRNDDVKPEGDKDDMVDNEKNTSSSSSSSFNKRRRSSNDGDEVMVADQQNRSNAMRIEPTPQHVVVMNNNQPATRATADTEKTNDGKQSSKSDREVSNSHTKVKSSSSRHSASRTPTSSSSSNGVIHNIRPAAHHTPMTIITESEIPLHLEERAAFSVVVTPEVSSSSADGMHRRAMVFGEQDRLLPRALFASTFMSSVRYVALRLLVLSAVAFGVYYYHQTQGISMQQKSAVISSSNTPTRIHAPAVESNISYHVHVSPIISQPPPPPLVTESSHIIIADANEITRQPASDEELGLIDDSILSDLSFRAQSITATVEEGMIISHQLSATLQDSSSILTSMSSSVMADYLDNPDDVVGRLAAMHRNGDTIDQHILPLFNQRVAQSDAAVRNIQQQANEFTSTVHHHDDVDRDIDDVKPVVAMHDEVLDRLLAKVDENLSQTNAAALESIGRDIILETQEIVDRAPIDRLIDEQASTLYHRHRQAMDIISEPRDEPHFDDMTLTLTLTGELHSSPSHTAINYASTSRGGRVVPDDLVQHQIRLTSPPYSAQRGPIAKFRLKIGLLQKDSNPQSIVQDTLPDHQGNRYCIAGSEGQITITLRHPVQVSAISVFNPVAGTMLSDATVLPRSIRAIGWATNDEHGLEMYELGTYHNDKISLGYEDEMTATLGGQWMHFPITTTEHDHITPLRAVTFMILSNHGNEQQTCIYRMRVSGLEQRQAVLPGLLIEQEMQNHLSK